MGSLGDKVAIRRINIDGPEVTMFCNLTGGLMNELNDLGVSENAFNMYWEDGESHLIRIGNNNDLLVALENMKGPVYKIIVELGKDEDSGRFIVISSIYLLCIADVLWLMLGR